MSDDSEIENDSASLFGESDLLSNPSQREHWLPLQAVPWK